MTDWWVLNAFLIVSNLNPQLFSKSLLCPGNTRVVVQALNHPRVKDEAEGERHFSRSSINAVL